MYRIDVARFPRVDILKHQTLNNSSETKAETGSVIDNFFSNTAKVKNNIKNGKPASQ